MKTQTEIVASTCVTIVCILCISVAWFLERCDSNVAVGALLALSGVDLISKFRGGKVPPSAAPIAILGVFYAVASWQEYPLILALARSVTGHG